MVINVGIIGLQIICVSFCCCKTFLCFSDPNSALPDQQKNLNKDSEVETKPTFMWDTYDPINQLYLELGNVIQNMGVTIGALVLDDCYYCLRVFQTWGETEPFML